MLRRVVGMVCLSVIGTFSSAQAQQYQQPATPPKGTPLKVDGTVSKVVPGQGILVSGKDGKQYGVGFDSTSKVSLMGVAGAEFLTPNTYVQFDVKLDDKMQPVGEVKKIMITVKDAINTPGLFSSAGPDGKVGEAGDYFVRGAVKTNKNNELTVTAGAKPITVKLAADIAVPVTITTWQLAQPGDGISGDGTAFVTPGAPMTPVLGTRIEIKAVMPIDPGKKTKK